jgi:protein-S-isoprenylcysteine O-methyltransferase Ste14
MRFTAKERLLASKIGAVAIGVLTLVTHPSCGGRGILEVFLQLVGFTLVVSAAMGRAWVVAYISGRKTRDLVTDGPYSIVRHPLYFFSALGFVGAGLLFASFVVALALLVIFMATHWPAIRAEETQLRAKFGREFVAYEERVPRFVPKPWLLTNPDVATFAPRPYSRAIIESSLILLLLPLSVAVSWAHHHGLLPALVRMP